jgi:hypothetical protein
VLTGHFIQNHYREAIQAVQSLEDELVILRSQLRITNEAFTQYLASEKKDFQDLTEPSPMTTLKSQYVGMLLNLSQCRYNFTVTKNLSATYPQQIDRNGLLLRALQTRYSHLLLWHRSTWRSTRFSAELTQLTQNFKMPSPMSSPLRTASTLRKDGLQLHPSTKHITKPPSRQIMREPLMNCD